MKDIQADNDSEWSASASQDQFDRSLLRAMKEASPVGILVVDQNAVVIEFNDKFLEIWRLPRERLLLDRQSQQEIPDHPVLMTVTQRVKDPEAFLERIHHLNDHPEATDHSEIVLKDGRTIERDSVGLWGDDDEYLGRIWFFRDITERTNATTELEHLASRDPLTELLNRRHFFERARQEQARARRHHHPLSVVMFDLDHFKDVNDHYGHGAGDRVLMEVTRRCNATLRQEDIFARIGGEEFAVLLPDTNPEAARVLAERLRAGIAEAAIPTDVAEVACSISLGVAPVSERDPRIEDALARADEALYRAKVSGRNRVFLYQQDT